MNASCLQGIGAVALGVPAKRLTIVPDGSIIGNNFVLGPNGEAYSPSPATTSADLNKLVEENAHNHQGFVAEPDPLGPMAYFIARESRRVHERRALFLHNLEPSNYGSFLFRQLPQMLLLRSIPIEFDVYVVPERTLWLREALILCGLPAKPIYTVKEVGGDRFRTIALFNEFDAEGFAAEDTAAAYIALSRTVWSSGPIAGSRNIYISRSLSMLQRPEYRPLVNEDIVEEIFRRAGFEIVHPEGMSLPEQIAIFRGARRIAGPSGSGMLNAIFSEPGATVLDLESFHYTVRQHAKIYSSTGKRYSFLFGEVEQSPAKPLYLCPWRANPRHVDEGIEWLLT